MGGKKCWRACCHPKRGPDGNPVGVGEAMLKFADAIALDEGWEVIGLESIRN